MSRVNYHEYLASREWALLKRQVRERCGGRCERCLSGPYEATHHNTYERLGHENMADLLAVCNPCHEYLSGISDVDPAADPLTPTQYLTASCWYMGRVLANGYVPSERVSTAMHALMKLVMEELG